MTPIHWHEGVCIDVCHGSILARSLKNAWVADSHCDIARAAVVQRRLRVVRQHGIICIFSSDGPQSTEILFLIISWIPAL